MYNGYTLSKKPPENVLSFKSGEPSPAHLMREIRKRAEDRDNVWFKEHAFDRKQQRSITQEDVYRVLRCGEIEGKITKGNNVGEYKVLVTFRPKGERKIGVVTVVVDNSSRLYVITVMWRDA